MEQLKYACDYEQEKNAYQYRKVLCSCSSAAEVDIVVFN